MEIAGITTHPTEQWMKQMARNVTCLRRSSMANSGHELAAVDQRWRNHPRESAFVSTFLPYGRVRDREGFERPLYCGRYDVKVVIWPRRSPVPCLWLAFEAVLK